MHAVVATTDVSRHAPSGQNMNMVVLVLFLLSILLSFLVILGFMVK